MRQDTTTHNTAHHIDLNTTQHNARHNTSHLSPDLLFVTWRVSDLLNYPLTSATLIRIYPSAARAFSLPAPHPSISTPWKHQPTDTTRPPRIISKLVAYTHSVITSARPGDHRLVAHSLHASSNSIRTRVSVPGQFDFCGRFVTLLLLASSSLARVICCGPS